MKHLGYQGKPQFNASLDHSVYFHDDDFDVTKWCTTFMKVSRICNDRALIKAEIYSNNGLHIASIVQERLWITGVPNCRYGYDFMHWCYSQASG